MPSSTPHATHPKRLFRTQVLSKSQARSDVDAELAHHLELCGEELVASGWSETEAAAEAERRFGDLKLTKAYCARETSRAMSRERRTMWIDDARQDFKFGLRTLVKSPTYSMVVIAALAIGIGANTTIFSLMNPYLFRPLPFAEAHQLLQLDGDNTREQTSAGRFSAAQVADLASDSEAFEALGYYYYGTTNLTGNGAAQRLNVGYLSGNLFSILGTPPLRGRYLTVEDGTSGAPVVVIGEKLWRSRFDSDPTAVGSTMQLDGVARTIVGVMPQRFAFPFRDLYLWLPTNELSARTQRGSMSVLPIGRLSANWSKEQAEAELNTAHKQLAERHPDLDGRYDAISTRPLREALNFAWSVLNIGFFLLLGAVGFVLVMACLNVASITLARARSRTREVAIRSAAGAQRSRLVRQFVTESFILAIAGGAVGVGLSFLATRFLNRVIPDDLFRVGEVAVDGRVLAFSALVTLLTPILFGLAPALGLARPALMSSLRTGGNSGGGRQAVRGRKALVFSQVTLAIVLVTGTGLMIRSLQAVAKVDLGFDAEQILTASVTPKAERYRSPEGLNGYFQQVKQRLGALPGVESVASASHLPLNHESVGVRYQAGQGVAESIDEWPSALTSRVDGEYFEAMGIPLLTGRSFTAADFSEGQSVVITRDLAERLYANQQSAVGQTLRYGNATGSEPSTGVVVGVVEEVRYSDLTTEAERPHLYRPLEGSSVKRRFLVAKTNRDTAALAPTFTKAIELVDPDVPATIRAYSEVVKESTLLWTMSSFFLGIFGLVAILLAALGIYGLMAFTVSQRRKEMGLRIALGAESGVIQRGVVIGAMKLVTLGLVVGLSIALLGANAARNVLFGVSAMDPTTLGGVLVLFLMIALVAAAIPARRAARVDPLQVLRSD